MIGERASTRVLADDPVRAACLGAREPGAFAARWGSVLAAAGVTRRILGARAMLTHYKPYTRARLVFEVHVARRRPERDPRRCYVSLQFYGDPATAARRLNEARTARKRALYSLGPSAFEIPEWNAVAWVLPNAPRLRILRSFLRRKDFMRVAKRAHLLAPGERLESKPALVRYVPRRRAVLRWESRFGTLWMKAYGPGTDVGAARNLAWLASSLPADGGSLRVPAVVAHVARRRSIVMRGLPGALFSDRFAHECAEDFRAVGRALAELHALTPSLERRVDEARQLEALRAAAGDLARALPWLQAPLRALGSSLAGSLPACSAPCPVHGNLFGDQILIHGTSVGIVDWDDLALGSPAFDLGRLAAHAIFDGLNRGRCGADMLPLVGALLGAYAEQRGVGVALPELRWHLVTSLVLRAKISALRPLAERWPERVETAVAEAQGLWTLKAAELRGALRLADGALADRDAPD